VQQSNSTTQGFYDVNACIDIELLDPVYVFNMSAPPPYQIVAAGDQVAVMAMSQQYRCRVAGTVLPARHSIGIR
jgi:hypothetical protein